MTRDVILALSLLLVAGLTARLLATLLRIPEIVVLLAVGAALGPSALDVIDVPLDSLGAQLVFTLGVSSLLFYGGLNLSLAVLRGVWVGLGLLAILGVILTAVVTGAAAAAAFGLPFEQGLLIGAVLSPTDPAILIPLFVGSRLRPKVAQTVVAESALNGPHRGGPRARHRGCAAVGGELAHRAGRRLRGAAGAEHRRRPAGGRRALGHDLEPQGRRLA
jgi:cell volume regulation protein A